MCNHMNIKMHISAQMYQLNSLKTFFLAIFALIWAYLPLFGHIYPFMVMFDLIYPYFTVFVNILTPNK